MFYVEGVDARSARSRLVARPAGVKLFSRIMPLDTTPEAAAIQAKIFRGMTAAERLRLALEMSDSLRNMALAGLRSREPELSAGELSRELIRMLYGFVAQP